ncbi:MAG: hypothetical protein RI973_1783 [Bacteroidota bacterium]
MLQHRTLLVCLPMFSLPLLLHLFKREVPATGQGFHTRQEKALFNSMLTDTSLSVAYNELFAGSGTCQKCHGYDTLGIASVDANGQDVNVVDDWRATMMANSARDPFWRAKVSHEVLLHPQHQAAIEDKCTSCHAPMGHFNAKHIGATHYLMADLLGDELAQDGVSCLACHMQSQESLGLHFSGEMQFDTFKMAYGPYTAPLVSPMLTETGYKPKFSPLMHDADQCAACHTLVTETIDLEGNFTGNTFIEQATYHEWLNSSYRESASCQECHMPNLDKWPVYLVTGAQTEPRNPYYLHGFVGGNVTMLGLLRDNVEVLGLKASPGQFQEVIAKTVDMLQDKTLELELQLESRADDTAMFHVKLRNKAGHKFPSGYPSRRAFIEFCVRNEAGDTLFVSGKTDGNFEVLGQNADYEPHYQLIEKEDEVQIYEQVLGDVSGNVTTVLVRASEALKDNRLPPLGFLKSHPAYDSTRIAGDALLDTDFNLENGVEGSGTDQVFYRIAVPDEEALLVSAKVFYQSTPPKWMKEMFDEHTAEIDLFRGMFDAADRTPVLVQSAEGQFPGVVATRQSRKSDRITRVYPTLSADGRLFVESSFPHDLKVFDLQGKPLLSASGKSGNYELVLPRGGVYLLKFHSKKGKEQVEKVFVR